MHRLNFCGTDPHSARIQGGIRTAVNEHTVPPGYLDEIPMGPDTGILRKIGRLIRRAVLIAPGYLSRFSAKFRREPSNQLTLGRYSLTF